MRQTLLAEFERALEELKVARNQFETALPAYIDAATYKLKAAEEKVDALKFEVEQMEKELRRKPLSTSSKVIQFFKHFNATQSKRQGVI